LFLYILVLSGAVVVKLKICPVQNFKPLCTTRYIYHQYQIQRLLEPMVSENHCRRSHVLQKKILIIINWAKTISLQTLFRRLNKEVKCIFLIIPQNRCSCQNTIHNCLFLYILVLSGAVVVKLKIWQWKLIELACEYMEP
jgi:hypothetical protein